MQEQTYFFKEEKHSIDLVKEALNRAEVYADAGADGIYPRANQYRAD